MVRYKAPVAPHIVWLLDSWWSYLTDIRASQHSPKIYTICELWHTGKALNPHDVDTLMFYFWETYWTANQTTFNKMKNDPSNSFPRPDEDDLEDIVNAQKSAKLSNITGREKRCANTTSMFTSSSIKQKARKMKMHDSNTLLPEVRELTLAFENVYDQLREFVKTPGALIQVDRLNKAIEGFDQYHAADSLRERSSLRVCREVASYARFEALRVRLYQTGCQWTSSCGTEKLKVPPRLHLTDFDRKRKARTEEEREAWRQISDSAQHGSQETQFDSMGSDVAALDRFLALTPLYGPDETASHTIAFGSKVSSQYGTSSDNATVGTLAVGAEDGSVQYSHASDLEGIDFLA